MIGAVFSVRQAAKLGQKASILTGQTVQSSREGAELRKPSFSATIKLLLGQGSQS